MKPRPCFIPTQSADLPALAIDERTNPDGSVDVLVVFQQFISERWVTSRAWLPAPTIRDRDVSDPDGTMGA